MSMKKEISKTKKYIYTLLLTLIVPFVLACLLYMIDDGSPIASAIIVIQVFALFIIVPMFIAHILKNIVSKVTSGHSNVETVAYSTVSDEIHSNNIRIYNRHKILSMDNSGVNWAGIMVMLAILPPVGIYFLFRKMEYEKTLYYANGTKMVVIGCAMMILTLLPVLFLMTADGVEMRDRITVLAYPGFYFLCGFVYVLSGLIYRRKGRINDTYMKLITVDTITRIDKIADTLGVSYCEATRRISLLSDMGLLDDAYIYHRDREVIVPGISKKVARKCHTCMGTTVFYSNEERTCVYCGEKL